MSDTTREIPNLTDRRLGTFNRFSRVGRKAVVGPSKLFPLGFSLVVKT
jgi:hypothetical protein